MKKSAAIFALLIASTTAHAADKNGEYQILGAGTVSCQAYLSSNKEDREYAETWWAGYVTAMNRTTERTWSVVGQNAVERVSEEIRKQCRNNPKTLFAIAVHDALEELYDKHRIAVSPN